MQIKLLTFRYSASVGGFDDSPLSEFVRDKDVLSFREHFFRVNEIPHLTCVISYEDRAVAAPSVPVAMPAAKRGKTDKTDPTAALSEADRALFETIRVWRARRAQDDGVPPYVVLTNRHLVAVVTARPGSLTALGRIDGVGPAKVKRYGTALLALLRGEEPSA